MKKNGFTLIELLVVIAIFGVVIAIVIQSLNGARDRARFTKLLTQYDQLEKGLYAALLEENLNDYWTEGQLGLGQNPTISEILDIDSGPGSSISNYIPKGFANAVGGGEFHYDNDNNPYVDCGDSILAGVNFTVFRAESNFDTDDLVSIDSIIDGSDDPSCGQFTYNQAGFIYRLDYRIEI